MGEKEFDFNIWHKKYTTVEKIDVDKYLSEEDRKTLEKLEIEIQDKIYTEYEYELLQLEISRYYMEIEPEDYQEEELKEYCKSLEEKGVSKIDYLKLLDTFDRISNECKV